MDKNFELGRILCKCGCDSFEIVLLPTPSTPAHIKSVMTKCNMCGLMREFSSIEGKIMREEYTGAIDNV